MTGLENRRLVKLGAGAHSPQEDHPRDRQGRGSVNDRTRLMQQRRSAGKQRFGARSTMPPVELRVSQRKAARCSRPRAAILCEVQPFYACLNRRAEVVFVAFLIEFHHVLCHVGRDCDEILKPKAS